MSGSSSVVARSSNGDRTRPLDEIEVPANGNGNGHKPLPTIGGRLVDPERISAEVEEMGADEAIAWAVDTFGPRNLPAAFFISSVSPQAGQALGAGRRPRRPGQSTRRSLGCCHPPRVRR